MKILIWGTGKISARYLKYGFFSAHDIVGFIDTFKKEPVFEGYSVYLPSQIGRLSYDCLVICVLKSNEAILNSCIKEGVDLKKVIFINAEAGFGEVAREHVEKLPNDEYFKELFPVMYMNHKEHRDQQGYMQENFSRNKFTDDALIKYVGDSHVVAWIPVELLFSERAEDNVLDNYTEEWKAQNREWENHPLVCFKPYESLYRFLMRGEKFPSLYCQWWQR
ncbi:hypothetical protein NZ47_11360, partial [Anaerovibrio lipolyticus]